MKYKTQVDREDLQKAYLYGQELLSRRGYSETRLQKKLEERGFLRSVAEKVVQDFKSKRFINDELLAAILIENYIKYKPYGFYKIKNKLKEKGFKDPLISNLLSSYFSVEQETKVISRLMKRVEGLVKKPISDPKKQVQSLLSKGFRPEAVMKIVKYSSREDA